MNGTAPDVLRNLGPLRLAWSHGGWRERFFVTYFLLYTGGGIVGLLTLVFLGAPFEMVTSYGLAFTFGLVGLWPLWFMAFMLSTPVLRALAEHPNLDDLRRPLYATMLAYT